MAKKMVKLECPTCGNEFEKSESYIRAKQKERGQTVFYCSRECGYEAREKEMIVLNCDYCGKEFQRYAEQVRRRKKIGVKNFYCSKECQNKGHAERMKGKGNPNYGGKFHGIPPSEWDADKRKKAIEKMKKTFKEKGIVAGENNPRWRGGRKKVTCIICGNEYYVQPHVYDKIQAGERKPCCGLDCARIYGLTQVKTSRTDIEIKVAEELEKRGIKFIEQYNLGNKFALDFFLPDYNIVIECDGDYWHKLPDVAKRDKSKNAYIKACGYTLYRFWGSEIMADVSKCIDSIDFQRHYRKHV